MGYNIYQYPFAIQLWSILAKYWKLSKNAENDIFLLVSSNLMSIFSPNLGHQEKVISISETTIIQLNIFNENHPVATF